MTDSKPRKTARGKAAAEPRKSAGRSKTAAKPRTTAGRGKNAAKPRAAAPATWPVFKALALSLKLPHVVETTSWGQPTLKAHGKLWCWWSPQCDAPVFKVPFEEREHLLATEPELFFVHPHYLNHPLVLMRPEKFDARWAKTNLLRVWREMAPKRVLKAYDDANSK